MNNVYWVGDPKLILAPELYNRVMNCESDSCRVHCLRKSLSFFEAKIQPFGSETYSNDLQMIPRPDFARQLTESDFKLLQNRYATESRYVCFVPAQSSVAPADTVVFTSNRTPSVVFNSKNGWYTSITILVAGFGSVAATRTPTGERRMYK